MNKAKIQVDFVDCMGDDLSVVNAARVSFHKESEWEYKVGEDFDEKEGWTQCYYEHGPSEGDGYGVRLKAADVKLINYLAKHKHVSPFNHTFISVRVKAPVFVARQLV